MEPSANTSSYNKEIDLKKYSEILADNYTLKILADTFINPKSAQEISIKHDIPIAACYRRVHSLESLGLLKCTDTIVNRYGKRVKRYISCIRSILLIFERGIMNVKLDLTTSPEIAGTIDVLSETVSNASTQE